MFLGIAEFIHCPQNVIPSFVWLEEHKEIEDFWGQMFEGVPSFPDVLHDFGQGISEREFTSLGIGCSACDGSSVPALVKDRPQIVRRVKEDAWKKLGDFASKDYFVDFLSRLRVLIDDVGPWATVDKIADHGIEIVNVKLCPSMCKASAIKDVGHVRQTRSDERARFSKGGPSFRDDAA
jgi:hypothetical protein